MIFERQFYTLGNLADELNVGESTLKYWLDLYEEWIPYSDHRRERWYPRAAIEILRFIAQRSHENAEPSEIKKQLNQLGSKSEEMKQIGTHALDNTNHFSDAVSHLSPLLLPFLEEFAIHQKRIANAQERRAAAEEKKADALDKRATAEQLKAEAMNNLASALKSIGLKGQGGETLEHLLADMTGTPQPTVDLASKPKLAEGPVESGSEWPMEADALDDLQELMNTPDLQPEALQDDLSRLTDSAESTPPAESGTDASIKALEQSSDLLEGAFEFPTSEIDDLSTLFDAPQHHDTPPVTDDLSALLDEPQTAASPGMDDLSALVDDQGSKPSPDIDDLASLIDAPQARDTSPVDDLSLLIGDANDTPAQQMDDLSMLFEETPGGQAPIPDDLSALLDEAPAQPTADVSPGMDDLSQLIDTSASGEKGSQNDELSSLLAPPPTEPAPPKKSAPAPKKEAKKKGVSDSDYKNKIIAIVIKMKEKEKLTHEQAAKKLNEQGVKPITGQGEWENDAMLEIYNYIDIVKATREH